MTASYEVKGTAYKGLPVVSKEYIGEINRIIKREMFKLGHAPSGQVSFPITETSWPQNLDMPANFHIRGKDGNLYTIISTANNPAMWIEPVEVTKKYGRPSPQVDDVQGYKRWVDACERFGPNYFSVVTKANGDDGIIVKFEDVPAEFHPKDTPLRGKHVNPALYEGDINFHGRAVSEAENSRQSIIRYDGSKVGRDLSDYLSSEGLHPEVIEWLGINVGMPKGAIYGVGASKDGKMIFAAAKDVYGIIAREAEALGIDPETFRNYGITEEQFHGARKSYRRIASGKPAIREEIDTKKSARSFYLRMAELSKGNPKLERVYRKLAEVAEGDIATTPQRYRQSSIFSKGLEEIVNNEGVEVSTDSDGKVYTVVDGKRVIGGDGAYMPTDLITSNNYDGASHDTKINKADMRSMSDAKAMLATERDVRNQEVSETSDAAE